MNAKSLGYIGGKYNLSVVKALINNFPPHERFIKLFAGTGGVLAHKEPAKENYAIEIDRSMAVNNNYPAGTEVIYDCVFRNRQLITTATATTLIYADPPYDEEVVPRLKDYYKYTLTNKQHIELRQLFSTTQAKVAISGYHSKLYDKLYKDWRYIELPVMSRGGPRTEVIWFNYPEPKVLHEVTHVGENKDMRQRLRRKTERLLSRLKQLPDQERQFILTALQQFDR